MTIPTSGASVASQATAKAFIMVDPEYLARFMGGGKPPSPVFVCRYNPKDMTVTGGATWQQPETNQEHDLGAAMFTRPKPRTIKLRVLVDQFELPSGDVSAEVDILFDWTKPRTSVVPEMTSAPWLRFQWGAKRWFKCYISTLSVSYTLFSRVGTPLRAMVDLTLEETKDPLAGTNPTSGGEGGERRHVVGIGESLHSIATRYYGHPHLWRGIAEFNGIDDPLRLSTGQVVALPLAADVRAMS